MFKKNISFEITGKYFLLRQNIFVWKNLVCNYITVRFILFDLNFVYFIMQNKPVVREWDGTNWLDLLIRKNTTKKSLKNSDILI